MERPTLRYPLHVLLILVASGLLASCGSGGDGGGNEADGPVTYDVPPPDEPLPPAPPPAPPPPAPPPPPEEPPEDPPEEPTPPPGEPVDPPAPSGPRALPAFASYDGFEQVAGVAVHPVDGALYAVTLDTHELLRLDRGASRPTSVGATGLVGVRALTFDGPGSRLLAVRDGEPGHDDTLWAIDPHTAGAHEIGTVTGYDALEGVAFHGSGPARRLYAVDTDADLLLALDPATALPTVMGPLGEAGAELRALTADPIDDLLLGVDAASGHVVALDPATGAARRMIRLAGGPLRALAYAHDAEAPARFLGVAVDDGKLHALDPKGTWLAWDGVLGLTYDEAAGELFGAHAAYGAIVRADPESGWRQLHARIEDAGLEGLAFDAGLRVIHAVSSATGALYRIRPEDGEVQAAGTATGPAGAWQGLRALAFARGALWSVHADTGTVLRVDAATGATAATAEVAAFGAVQGLAYDAASDRLLLHGPARGELIALEPAAGATPEVLETVGYEAIGALAWLPDRLRLVGSDLADSRLATLRQLDPAGLGFDEVQALAPLPGAGDLGGFDVATAAFIGIDLAGGRGTTLQAAPGLDVRGMANDAHRDRTFAIDAASRSLYVLDAAGLLTRVGAPGALGAADLRALAYDPGADPEHVPGTLYSFDNAARKLVRVDLASGAVTPLGDAVPMGSIEALAWDTATAALLAIDRTTRALLEFDPADGSVVPVGLVEFADVRGMTCFAATEEIVVTDASLDRIALVDRYTGMTLETFEAPVPHRGSADAAHARLLWPRGDARRAHLRTLALEASEEFPKEARLVIRRGEALLHASRFAPSTTYSAIPLPDEVRKQVAAGDTFTWGLEFADGSAAVLVEVRVQADDEAARDLAALAARPYLRRQAAHVRAVRTARALLRRGLASEALPWALYAGSLRADYAPARRALTRAQRALFEGEAFALDDEPLRRLLGADAALRARLGLPGKR